jgi:hypothetical protein
MLEPLLDGGEPMADGFQLHLPAEGLRGEDPVEQSYRVLLGLAVSEQQLLETELHEAVVPGLSEEGCRVIQCLLSRIETDTLVDQAVSIIKVACGSTRLGFELLDNGLHECLLPGDLILWVMGTNHPHVVFRQHHRDTIVLLLDRRLWRGPLLGRGSLGGGGWCTAGAGRALPLLGSRFWFGGLGRQSSWLSQVEDCSLWSGPRDSLLPDEVRDLVDQGGVDHGTEREGGVANALCIVPVLSQLADKHAQLGCSEVEESRTIQDLDSGN